MKTRIQVYTDDEMKRRIALAAAKYHLSVTEYCFGAVQERLTEDNLLDQASITIPISPKSEFEQDQHLITDLRALHQEMMAYRQGQPLDLDADLEAMREERMCDLPNLR